MAMWGNSTDTDTDLCTRQSHLCPRWATSRIGRCIVRPGIPSGKISPRTARWRSMTRWWRPLQGRKSQEYIRAEWMYSCIFILDTMREFRGLGTALVSISFLLSFTKRHVYKLLLRLSKRDSCVFPSFYRVWGVDVLSILAGVGLVSNRQIFS